MKRKIKRVGTSFVATLLCACLVGTTANANDGFKTYKGSNMIEYFGDYDYTLNPYKELQSDFTTASIAVDGILEEAYQSAQVSRIENFRTKDGYGKEPGNVTYGEIRTLWNGPELYLGISVYDDCVLTSTETTKGAVSNPAVAGTSEVTYPYKGWGGFWDTWAVVSTKETCDSIALAVDLYNDRTTYELDTAGVVTIDALGQLYYYSSSSIPSLGSALGDPTHPEYMNIIKGYAAAPMYDGMGNQIGYTVEVSLAIEDLEMNNGTQIGVDVKINDVNEVVTGYKTETVLNPDYQPPVEEEPEEEIVETSGPQDMSDVEVITEEPAEEEPAAEEPAAEEPVEEEAVAEEPAAEEPAAEEPAAEEPAAEEPVAEEPVAEEPVAEEPVAEEPAEEIPEYIEVEVPVLEVKKSANIFWSHNQDSLYTDFDHEHTNSTDWGLITLAGWNQTDEFAYSEWRITKLIDYMESASFAKGVYTSESQTALDAALMNAKAVVESEIKDKAVTLQAAEALENAFFGLKWADTRYPDPSDLEKQVTLPNPYKFFNSSRMVQSTSDWEERRAEILDLAQFYEYGYKPEYDSLTIKSASYHHKGDKYMRESRSVPGTWKEDVYTDTGANVVATVTVGSVSRDISFDIVFPDDAKIAASGHEGERLPIVLSYDGTISSYIDAGLAMITVPSVVSDTRTNDYAWNNRTGLFYELYPYSRNGENALKEVSNEMAEAWAASVVIDALEACEASTDETIHNAVSAVSVDKFAVTGFSINGKYAFVAGVFDDRIDVVIPGAAGATGPSPWRYVYRGQKYDWTGTAYTNPSVDSLQTAWGTEVMANSVRHNRVRETELFRHFLSFGHFYEFEEDAYGYATRLPYDQNDLVATLAPRAIVIENTVNDYNDGCTADCLGAEIAKSVYNNLGYDADSLVKFNLRGLKTGDPHGNDSEQRNRSAQYVNNYFFGTQMSEDVDAYLNTDPFALNISNDGTDNPYNYYWGGFNTITGGKDGVEGTDGWYYYELPKNGFYKEDGTTYYYVNNKRTYAGLIQVGEDFYYVKGDGSVATGSYYVTHGNDIMDRGHAQFDEDGKMILNGVIKIRGEYYYYENSRPVENLGLICWKQFHYYIGEGGKALTGMVNVVKTNGIVNEGIHEFSKDGKMVLDGIIMINGKLRYYVDGKMRSQAGMIRLGDDMYYVGASAEVATGKRSVGSRHNGLVEPGMHYFDEVTGKFIR